jgi:dihydropyrimidinase
VFVETRPLYLHLTTERFDADDAEAALYIGTPPLRGSGDRERLWEALGAGDINAVGSDHVGFTRNQKYRPGDTFETVPKGVANMESMLAMLYSDGVREGRISVEQLADVTATQPAKIFGLYPQKGVIREGSDADLCVFDPEKRRTVDAKRLHSAADFDLFEGLEVTGWPAVTVSRGEVVFEDGAVRAKRGRGQLVKGNRQREALSRKEPQ